MLVALVTISALIAVILAIAWRDFGRPAHALTWAIAFTLASIAWAATNIGQAFPAFGPMLEIVATGLATWSNAAIAIGYRQRAGEAPHMAVLIGAGALVTLADAMLSGIDGVSGVRAALPVLFAALTIGLAARTLTGRRAGERAAERVTMIVLVTLASFHLATAVLAILAGDQDRNAELMLFHSARLLVLPAALTGTGLFSVFLLAADLSDRMRRLAANDPLTGILNRRGFEDAAKPLLDSARRQRRPVSVVLADIDRFKTINDVHGHAAGDRALQRFAEHIGAAIRRRDLFGRIGGEEFAIILPDTRPDEAETTIEQLRIDLAASMEFEVALTASFGIAAFHPDEDVTLARVLARADRALYASKQDGRNRVTLIV
jgi:diguanylate cyclase (GGDEF)-like protein